MAGEAPPSQRVNRRVFAERVGCLCATLALSKAGASTRAELRVVTGGSGEFGREVARLMQRRFPNFVQGDDFQTLARREGPGRYVSVGPAALASSLRSDSQDPLIALLVSAPAFARITASHADRGRLRRATAIFAEASPEAQLDLIAELFKRAVQVGVLLSDESASLEPRLHAAARRRGMELQVHRISANANPVREMNRLADSTVILSIPDAGVFNNNTFAALLETTYGRGQGVVGFSTAMVRAGTVASAHASAEDLVEHLAEFLSSLDEGRLPEPQYPKYWRVEVNRSVARSLNLSVDEAVLALGVKPKGRTP